MNIFISSVIEFISYHISCIGNPLLPGYNQIIKLSPFQTFESKEQNKIHHNLYIFSRDGRPASLRLQIMHYRKKE